MKLKLDNVGKEYETGKLVAYMQVTDDAGTFPPLAAFSLYYTPDDPDGFKAAAKEKFDAIVAHLDEMQPAVAAIEALLPDIGG